jgi:starch synthase
MTELRVLSVASEAFPLVKTGGLADVVGALPAALAHENVAMRTLLPGYPAVLAALGRAETVAEYPALLGAPARLLAGRAAGLDLLALDAPQFFSRTGNPYVGPDGRDWPDNAQRFAALARAAADITLGDWPGLQPDLIHVHDWQAGLLPAYLAFAGRPHPPSVITVHNIAFQGHFPAKLLAPLGLPPEAFTLDGVEYFGGIGFLKAGLRLADRITTVSPTYSAEIRGPGGMGLEGLLQTRSAVLSGILNGIDDTVWNPAADPAIPAPFDARRLARRAANPAALRARLGLLPEPDRLLFGVVSRLTWQKGLDLLLQALPALLAQGAQLAVLGTGEPAIEHGFRAAMTDHPGRVGGVIGYDEALAHQILAGTDALLVPSRFEPCGLTQLCALRYGALPVVARVGGLADTVIDANPMALAAGIGTGVQFAPTTADALEFAIHRTAALWRDRPAWIRLQRNAMATDVSWRGPARHYARLFRELAGTT